MCKVFWNSTNRGLNKNTCTADCVSRVTDSINKLETIFYSRALAAKDRHAEPHTYRTHNYGNTK